MATELGGESLIEELSRLSPSELLLPQWIEEKEDGKRVWEGLRDVAIEKIEPWVFEKDAAKDILSRHFGTSTLEGFWLEGLLHATGAAAAIVHYLHETQRGRLSHIRSIKAYRISEFMHIDRHTRRNLELVEALDREDSEATLLWVLDKTSTRKWDMR